MATARDRKLYRSANGPHISLNIAHYRLTGSLSAALLLSHLSYLSREHFGEGEFYQTETQISKTLGFTRRVLQRAKEKLAKYVTFTPKGKNNRGHWIIHEDKIIDDLIEMRGEDALPEEPPITEADSTCTKRGTRMHQTVPPHAPNGATLIRSNNKQTINNNSSIRAAAADGSVLVDEMVEAKAKQLGMDTSERSLRLLLSSHKADYVLEKLGILEKKTGVTNPPGLLKVALEQDWRPSNPKPTAPREDKDSAAKRVPGDDETQEYLRNQDLGLPTGCTATLNKTNDPETIHRAFFVTNSQLKEFFGRPLSDDAMRHGVSRMGLDRAELLARKIFTEGTAEERGVDWSYVNMVNRES